jgi:hypothetical protein
MSPATSPPCPSSRHLSPKIWPMGLAGSTGQTGAECTVTGNPHKGMPASLHYYSGSRGHPSGQGTTGPDRVRGRTRAGGCISTCGGGPCNRGGGGTRAGPWGRGPIGGATTIISGGGSSPYNTHAGMCGRGMNMKGTPCRRFGPGASCAAAGVVSATRTAATISLLIALSLHCR